MMCPVDLKKTLPYRVDLDGMSLNPAYEWVNAYALRREKGAVAVHDFNGFHFARRASG